MKLFPRKRWQKALCFIFLVFLALAVSGAVLLQYVRASINQNIITPVNVLNAEGNPAALIVYQQSLSSGPKDAAYAYADGLITSGWRVEVTTASTEAPVNLSNYKLLVLAYPIYGARPGETITRYVENLGDMHQIDTVYIDCRWSNAVETVMKQMVEAQNGTVIQTLLAGRDDVKGFAGEIVP